MLVRESLKGQRCLGSIVEKKIDLLDPVKEFWGPCGYVPGPHFENHCIITF